ncbi:MAG: hypothetical protein ACTHN0_08920 [Aquihabitans sp.]
MAEVQIHRPETKAQWVRGHVLTRLLAALWWVVMVFLTVAVASSYVRLAVDRTIGDVAGAAVATIILIPLWREWPNARRMGRMLRHGT